MNLFEPITLRDLTIANRVWLSPMCQYAAFARDGVPTSYHQHHLAARAAGGFGLVITEATGVSPEGRISPQCLGIWDDRQRDAFAQVTAAIHSAGGAAAIQLAHAGRKGSTYGRGSGRHGSVSLADGGWETVAPSAHPYGGYETPREMSHADIAKVIDDFAAAAVRADQAGFDAVEIHAAHGYLLHQFLSPLSNHRTDGYGTDLAGRSRLVTEVATAVRAAFPAEKPILIRFSATDWVGGGLTVADVATVSRDLVAAGLVDLIDVSSGGNVPAEIPLEPGYQVPFAAQIKQAGVLTGAVGLITEPEHAEQVVRDGDADVVLLARAGLADAAWPRHAAMVLDAK